MIVFTGGLDGGRYGFDVEASAFHFPATYNDADASATTIKCNACLQQAP